MDSRNSDTKNLSSDTPEKKMPLNFEIDILPNRVTNTFSSTNQPDPGPLGRKSEWRPGKPWDPDWGAYPGDRKEIKKRDPEPKGESLAELIQMALDEKVDAYYGDGGLEKIERRTLWARHLADLVVFGQVTFPASDSSGVGRTIKMNADSYSKHALKMLRYLEPPKPEVTNPSGVTNIIFDIPIMQVREAEEPSRQVITVIDQAPSELDSPQSN